MHPCLYILTYLSRQRERAGKRPNGQAARNPCLDSTPSQPHLETAYVCRASSSAASISSRRARIRRTTPTAPSPLIRLRIILSSSSFWELIVCVVRFVLAVFSPRPAENEKGDRLKFTRIGNIRTIGCGARAKKPGGGFKSESRGGGTPASRSGMRGESGSGGGGCCRYQVWDDEIR